MISDSCPNTSVLQAGWVLLLTGQKAKTLYLVIEVICV